VDRVGAVEVLQEVMQRCVIDGSGSCTVDGAAELLHRKRHATGKRTPGIFYRVDRHGERAYEITWRDGRGKQHWQRVHGNLDDAKDALAEKRSERKRPSVKCVKTFAELLEGYKRSEDFTDLRDSTRTAYERALKNYVIPTFGNVQVSEITTRKVADWLKSLRTIERQRGQGSLSAWTRRGALTALRVVLRYAADEGLIPANPVDSLSRRQVPEPDEREVRVLDGPGGMSSGCRGGWATPLWRSRFACTRTSSRATGPRTTSRTCARSRALRRRTGDNCYPL
jgi:Phage integrase, N-terminal SAM-like domain